MTAVEQRREQRQGSHEFLQDFGEAEREKEKRRRRESEWKRKKRV